jgi:transposase-like protein
VRHLPSPLRDKKDPEEQGRSKRRRFEVGVKLRVLDEWDRPDVAQRSAIMRREGIYSSMISDWKRQAREGLLANNGSCRPDGRGGPSYAGVDTVWINEPEQDGEPQPPTNHPVSHLS